MEHCHRRIGSEHRACGWPSSPCRRAVFSRIGVIVTCTFVVAGSVLFAAALMYAARDRRDSCKFHYSRHRLRAARGRDLSLPAQALQPATRAVGMGIFFTVYYAGMFAAPALAGWLAGKVGTASIAFDVGAGALAIATVLSLAFPRLAKSTPAAFPA